MDILTIAEWIIWTLLLLIILVLSWGHYDRAVRRGLSFHKATPRILIVGWVLILIFLFTGFSKLHILWIFPVSVFLIMSFVTQKAIQETEKKFKELKK